MGIGRGEIIECMESLKSKEMPFHSEADFQHKFAWEMHERHPNCSVHLEVPHKHYKDGSKRKIHLDLLIDDAGKKIGLELKYKTAAFDYINKDVQFNLTSHGAQPISRYDIFKDVERLQNLISGKVLDNGYAIVLSNDKVLWSQRTKKNASGSDFLLTDKKANQNLTWKKGCKPGSIGSHRAEDIKFLYPVKVEWESWHSFPHVGNKDFKYIIIDCKSDG